MATDKVEEVPATEPAVEDSPKENVEEKLADLKVDDTPAPEEKSEEKVEEPEKAAPEAKVLEAVQTVDTQTKAPDESTEAATREVPTEVVHETVDEPKKPTLVEKIKDHLSS